MLSLIEVNDVPWQDVQRNDTRAARHFFMNVWRNLHQFTTMSVQATTDERPVPMRHSRPIEVDGVFLGAAVEHELGVRFIAVDVRVTEMDQSIWPTLDYAYRSVRQLYKSGRAASSF
jgi:hypothetical protein